MKHAFIMQPWKHPFLGIIEHKHAPTSGNWSGYRKTSMSLGAQIHNYITINIQMNGVGAPDVVWHTQPLQVNSALFGRLLAYKQRKGKAP